MGLGLVLVRDVLSPEPQGVSVAARLLLLNVPLAAVASQLRLGPVAAILVLVRSLLRACVFAIVVHLDLPLDALRAVSLTEVLLGHLIAHLRVLVELIVAGLGIGAGVALQRLIDPVVRANDVATSILHV